MQVSEILILINATTLMLLSGTSKASEESESLKQTDAGRFKSWTNSRNNGHFQHSSESNIHGARNYFDMLTLSSATFKQRDEKTNFSQNLATSLQLDKFLSSEKERLITSGNQGGTMKYLQGLVSDQRLAINDDCYTALAQFMEAISNQSMWALEMIDAAGKPGAGILRQLPPSKFLGDFDECVEVETGLNFDTSFCSTILWIARINETKIEPPLSAYFAICAPSTCNATDLTDLINAYLFSMSDRITAGVINTNCQERELSLTTKAIVVICVCSVFATILVLATLYDIVYVRQLVSLGYDNGGESMGLEDHDGDSMSRRNPSEYEPLIDPQVQKKFSNSGDKSASGIGSKLLLSFSVYTNTLKMLSTTQAKDSIDCIHGIRFISMTWVILGHSYVMALNVFTNVKPYLDMSYPRFTFQAILNALVSVDTFFTLSGLLMTYLVLKELNKKGATPGFFGLFYFHRFWRLTPPYMLVMMTYVPLFKYIGDGPMWPQGGIEMDECEDSWWTNLLYINNFVRVDKMCMGWSWYLANDMQFFVISPLLFLPLFYFGALGLIVPFLFLLGTAITAGVITSVNDLPALLDILSSNENDYFKVYYIKPYTRLGPYIVGMITGYLLYRSECRVRLPKLVVILGWMAATAIALAVLYGLVGHAHEDPVSTEVAALYNALHKIAWGVSISWVIYACANGYGGFVNTILSWKILVPLSRLTYCAYLVHPLVIDLYAYTQRQPFYLDNNHIPYLFLGNLMLAYALAYIASMAYEAPMIGLEKVLRGGGRKKTEKI